MSTNYEYILSLRDRYSDTMRRITGSSAEAQAKFTQLKESTKIVERNFKDFGSSITSLRSKLDLLRSERDLINPKELQKIRQYNTEIKGLTKQIEKFETINGSKFKTNLKAAFGEIPAVLRNPVALAAAAVGFAGKSAMGFDEGMAKINITAQLGDKEKAALGEDIKAVVKRNKADLSVAPDGFEKIISQTGDAQLSLSILDEALRGSKAGFTDLDTVSGALAQTLSIVGKENTTAREVLDTFFAAKRVGAGEFKDFAQYMPGLIAGADTLGVRYKDVAGIFAYMTGKGQSAERASVLMTNMFSVMGKTDISSKLGKAGVDIFDKAGKMRGVVDIFKDLNAVTGTMTDEQKSQFFDKIGIVDKEAKASFAIMASDVDKLSTSLVDCRNAQGETDKALEFSRNSMQRATEVWNTFKNLGITLGETVLPIIGAGLTVLDGVLSGVSFVLEGVMAATGWWIDKLGQGNPIIWGLTSALGAALVLWKGHALWLKMVALWNGIVTLTTGGLSKAFTALKTSFLTTPWGLAIMGAAALVGGLVAVISRTDAAAKSFAAFNTEIRRNQQETQTAFDAASKATQGSEERAAAIGRVNETYGEYLPNLLTEKSNNDEIARALRIVNSELERKIRNKFRDQEIEGLLTNVQNAETVLYEKMLSGIDDVNAQKRIAEKVKALLPKMQSGQMPMREAVSTLFDIKSGEQTGFIRSGVGDAAVIDYINASKGYTQGKQIIEIKYADAPPTGTVTNNIYAGQASSGYLSWLPAQNTGIPGFPLTPAAQTQNTGATTTPNGINPTPTVTSFDQLMLKLGGGGNGGGGGSAQRSGSVDLDKIGAQDTKGSTTYGAIASKIASVRLPSLAKAAASIALPIAMGTAVDLPQAVPTTDPDAIGYYGQTENKKLTCDKVCDQIVINIASADGKGYDQIRSEIIEVVGQILNYDA